MRYNFCLEESQSILWGTDQYIKKYNKSVEATVREACTGIKMERKGHSP